MNGLKVLTAEEQVANILRADARRVRWLSRLTVLPLTAAVLLCAGMLVGFVNINRLARNTLVGHIDRLQQVSEGGEMTPEQATVAAATMMNYEITFGLLLLGLTAMFIAVAALGTVWLVHVSRRATLRQIQASLAEIAGQLATLNRGADGGEGRPAH